MKKALVAVMLAVLMIVSCACTQTQNTENNTINVADTSTSLSSGLTGEYWGYAESGTARPMFAIVAVVLALAVVKEREQAHHRNVGPRQRRQKKPVEFHLPPMRKAVDIRIHDPVAIDKIL